MDYRKELINNYWEYQELAFPNIKEYFKSSKINDKPPVFYPQTEWLNVIINPDANKDDIKDFLNLIPLKKRHRWFGSFNSSQALALSILGNLKSKLEYLDEIKDDEFNEGLLQNVQPFSPKFSLEFKVNYLNEPRNTSIDAFVGGEYQIAIECKFTEEDIGNCSRPKLTIKDANYFTDFCNGSYSIQRERTERCSLTEIGILYWKYIPYLFNWKIDIDYSPCPLNSTYQLVRNILAACLKPDSEFPSEDNGHALLLYDERNPFFQAGGKGSIAYSLTKDALKNKRLLRKCSWQKIVSHLRSKKEFDWLTKEIKLKYGI